MKRFLFMLLAFLPAIATAQVGIQIDEPTPFLGALLPDSVGIQLEPEAYDGDPILAQQFCDPESGICYGNPGRVSFGPSGQFISTQVPATPLANVQLSPPTFSLKDVEVKTAQIPVLNFEVAIAGYQLANGQFVSAGGQLQRTGGYLRTSGPVCPDCGVVHTVAEARAAGGFITSVGTVTASGRAYRSRSVTFGSGVCPDCGQVHVERQTTRQRRGKGGLFGFGILGRR